MLIMNIEGQFPARILSEKVDYPMALLSINKSCYYLLEEYIMVGTGSIMVNKRQSLTLDIKLSIHVEMKLKIISKNEKY